MSFKSLSGTFLQTQLLLQSLLVLFVALFSSPVLARSTCASLFATPKSVTTVDSIYRSGRSIYDLPKFIDLLKDLKKDPMMAEMLNGYNEKEKGIRIEEHVIQVFSQYLIERKSQLLTPQFTDILPITIALHDIGKPLAIKNGHRHLQHEYTIPLMKQFLTKHNYSKSQIDMAVALVSYSGLGYLARGVKSAFQISIEIHQIADALGVSAIDFYNAKRIFYSADAGAYTQLRPLIFDESSVGLLELKSERFLELEYWLRGNE